MDSEYLTARVIYTPTNFSDDEVPEFVDTIAGTDIEAIFRPGQPRTVLDLTRQRKPDELTLLDYLEDWAIPAMWMPSAERRLTTAAYQVAPTPPCSIDLAEPADCEGHNPATAQPP